MNEIDGMVRRLLKDREIHTVVSLGEGTDHVAQGGCAGSLQLTDGIVAGTEPVDDEVIQAHDGPAGLDAALRHRPEVSVCDIGLPRLDGYEFARRVRERPGLQTCVLIAVSGYGDSTDRERARTAGFDHHLTKPADPVQLADLIEKTSGGQ